MYVHTHIYIIIYICISKYIYRYINPVHEFLCLNWAAQQPILPMWALTTEGYGANGRLQCSNNRGLWRQTGSCNARKTNACGQSAWWKLPRGILSILRVLGVLRLASGRLERPNNRGLWRQTAGCNALTTEGYGGKREAATLEKQMLVARVLGGSCREGF